MKNVLKNVLHLDFESRSTQELHGNQSVGLDNYWKHQDTKALMLAYAYGDEPVDLWEIDAVNMPGILRKGLEDPDQPLAAWQSNFERYGLKYKIGIDIPIERWYDPQASSRYLSLPGSLDKVGSILNLPPELQKDKRGEDLIKLFSEPHLTRKKKGEEQQQYFNDKNSHLKEWIEFQEYCKQDVRAEREIMRRLTMLKVFPLPEMEQKIWCLDQKINDRGMPVNVQFVKTMYDLGVRSKREAVDKQNKLTGLENANSPIQMLAWAKTHGYEPNTLNKNTVEAQLKYHSDKLTPLAIEVLAARRAASSTTYKKLSAILRQVSPDGRLRNQFIYLGSSRCGRWSSAAAQIHNMARPFTMKYNGEEFNFEDEEVVDDARSMVLLNDYQGIKNKYGSVLLVIKNLIRTCFSVEKLKDRKLHVCDLNAIETRVGAYLAQCHALLDVFTPRPGKPNGNDSYIAFATKLTGISYEKLEADIKSLDKLVKKIAKDYRQMGKVGVLGCIYRMGGGGWGIHPKTKDTIKTGLWGYAEGYGVLMDVEQAHIIVNIFRESYLEIKQAWYDLENMIADVLKVGTTKVKREFGPNGCVKIDKLTIKQNDFKRYILRIQLPSGRFLHYMDAELQEVKMPWKAKDGNDVYRETLTYSGVDQETKNWKTGITSHGGKVFENIDQGFARDVIAMKLLEIENIGIEIDGHVHDEGIGETPDDPFYPDYQDMVSIMSQPIEWAPGLLLGADGFSGFYYHK